MMKSLQIIAATILGLAITAQAQDTVTSTEMDRVVNQLDKAGDTSVGIKWGDLTGVEAKHWYGQKNALILGVASDEGNTAVSFDHLWHFPGSFASVTGMKISNTLVPYIGAGLLGAFGGEDTDFFDRETEDFGLALRAPIGIEFLPRKTRLGIFAELAPSFAIVPTTLTFITVDIGARYYF